MMEMKAKQRVVGGLILVIIMAVILVFLFQHSYPAANSSLSHNNNALQPEVQLQLPVIPGQNPDMDNSNNDGPVDTTASSFKAVAQKTPDVSQKILNTA